MTLYKVLGCFFLTIGIVLFALYPLFVFVGLSPFELLDSIDSGENANPYPHLVHYLVACIGMVYVVWGLSLMNLQKSVVKPTGIGFMLNIVVHVLALMFAGSIASAIGFNPGAVKGIFVLELAMSIMMIAAMQRKGDA